MAQTRSSARVLLLSILGVAFIFVYQNCTSGFQTGATDGSSLTFHSEWLQGADGTVFDGAELSIPTFPQPWRVYQRNANNQAAISIQGTSPQAGTNLQMIAVNAAGQMSALANYAMPGVTNFGPVDFIVPAGGWYTIIANIQDANGNILASSHVWPVGVGEVFIAAGQSNSNDCCGQSPQPSTSPYTSGAVLTSGASDSGTLSWDWRIDSNPTAMAHGMTGGGPWPSFATQIANLTKVPVAVIQVGCGGTMSLDWMPGQAMQPMADYGSPSYFDATKGLWEILSKPLPYCSGDENRPGGLYSRLQKTLQMTGNVRSILWDQGESDMENLFFLQTADNWVVPQKAGDYYEHMSRIISQLNSDMGRSTPWFVAQASYMAGNEVDQNSSCVLNGNPLQFQSLMNQITADQQQIVRAGLAYAGPNTDALLGTIPNSNGQTYRYTNPGGLCAHFSTAGLPYLGRAWADAVTASVLLQNPMSNLPAGSYQMSCAACSRLGESVSCSCGNMAGQYVSSTVDMSASACGTSDVANIDGVLSCHSGGNLPAGSYQLSCDSCQLTGGSLSCSCGTMAGPFVGTSLNLAADDCSTGQISNINGNLICSGETPRAPSSVANPISDLVWSYAGPVPGRNCVQINEPSDPHTWDDNFLCGTRDWGFRWSYAGPIEGLHCVQINEPADHDAWDDNFLCSAQDYGLRWSYAGKIEGLTCISMNEPSDPDTWGDNYLCGTP